LYDTFLPRVEENSGQAVSQILFRAAAIVRAYTWASIATGSQGKDDRLMLLESRMTAAQIEDAHQRISNWEPQEVKSGSTVDSQKFPPESPQYWRGKATPFFPRRIHPASI
jgi:hypothetical protein